MFNTYQLQEIETGKKNKIDTSIYAKSCYDAKQMWVIRKGLEMDVPMLYLNAGLNWELMYEIYKFLVLNKDLDIQILQMEVEKLCTRG